MKKLILILDSTNWLEATWVEETVTQVEGETEIEGEIVKGVRLEDKVETTQLWCESFSGHKDHISMLRKKAKEFNTSLDEYESLIKKCQDAFVYPDDEDIKAEKEQNRIACIKNEARLIIESKYPIFWQLNYPRGDERFVNEYLWIDKIRAISNKAEEDGLEYNQIDWGV